MRAIVAKRLRRQAKGNRKLYRRMKRGYVRGRAE